MNNKTISTPQPQTFTGENPFKEKDLVEEPVAWCRKDTVMDWKGQLINSALMFPSPRGLKDPIPLYTHPAKTLTDEEIRKVWMSLPYDPDNAPYIFARAILRKAQE
jgi:hypothetical protein